MSFAKRLMFERWEKEARERTKQEREFYRMQRAQGIPHDECLDLETWEAFQHAMEKD